MLSDSDSWDYIVVGAGSAGCVVAGRLSEDASKRVLVLEAGPRDVALMKPFGLSYYFDMSRFEWGYWSQPDPTRNMRTDHWRRGRVVGGSGSVNGMNYVRGTRADYDRWAAMGNAGWSADDVMPLFQALERCEPGYEDSARRRDPRHVRRPVGPRGASLSPIDGRVPEGRRSGGLPSDERLQRRAAGGRRSTGSSTSVVGCAGARPTPF